ncbi:MAG: diguanylate cyclase [Gammaproteobacteria bacterium]|nr:diguanylate cyclase [Gammaproteobacteria bacterium]
MTGPGQAQDPEAERQRRRKLERALSRAEERLVDYERIVDRNQHLLNTRIHELEEARAALRARTEELEESETRFRQLAEAAFEAILVCEGTVILDCNDAAAELYGYPKERLVGNSILQLVEPASVEVMDRQLASARSEPFEAHHLRRDGTVVPVELRIREIHYRGADALVLAVRDITEHKEMEARLRHLASTDPLTGIANRRYFMERGRAEQARALRYDQPLSVMMLDVDHFKRINDTHGHDVGDQALKALTAECGHALRASDLLGRLGGEEFALLLPSTSREGGAILAERIRGRIEAMRIPLPSGELAFTVSIGICTLDGDESFDALLNRADKALYAAKHGGRNRVVEG